jgi:hypothetical protein
MAVPSCLTVTTQQIRWQFLSIEGKGGPPEKI